MDTLITLLFSSSTLMIQLKSQIPLAYPCLSFVVVLGMFLKRYISVLPGVPRVAQCKFVLPLCLVCCPTTASKNSKYKITVDTNKPPINLTEAFSGTPTQSTTTRQHKHKNIIYNLPRIPSVIYIHTKCVSMRYLVFWTNTLKQNHLCQH